MLWNIAILLGAPTKGVSPACVRRPFVGGPLPLRCGSVGGSPMAEWYSSWMTSMTVRVICAKHKVARIARVHRRPSGGGAISEGLGHVRASRASRPWPLRRNAFRVLLAPNGTATEGQRTPNEGPANAGTPLVGVSRRVQIGSLYSIAFHAHPLAFVVDNWPVADRDLKTPLQMDFGCSKKI
jgi:hypothetical protein